MEYRLYIYISIYGQYDFKKCKKNYIELTGILQNVDRIDGI